jgi:hypothetical protein
MSDRYILDEAGNPKPEPNSEMFIKPGPPQIWPIIETNEPTQTRLFRLIEIAHETTNDRIRNAALALFEWMSKPSLFAFEPTEKDLDQ